jgi:hypothetical protein
MERKLAWKDEKKFMGWACSNCGGFIPIPPEKNSRDRTINSSRQHLRCTPARITARSLSSNKDPSMARGKSIRWDTSP